MAAPTATEIRDFLEGYGITTAVLTNAKIEDYRDNEIIPHIEDITGLVFDDEITSDYEYYNGTGKDYLILNRRPVNEIVELKLIGSLQEGDLSGLVELVGAEGIIRLRSVHSEGVHEPVFRRGHKNIKVKYKYGTSNYPNMVANAIKNLVAAKCLNLIGARTGGGGLTVQAFGRNYGPHGKYQDIRKELVTTGYGLLRRYLSGVVGS